MNLIQYLTYKIQAIKMTQKIQTIKMKQIIKLYLSPCKYRTLKLKIFFHYHPCSCIPPLIFHKVPDRTLCKQFLKKILVNLIKTCNFRGSWSLYHGQNILHYWYLNKIMQNNVSKDIYEVTDSISTTNSYELISNGENRSF